MDSFSGRYAQQAGYTNNHYMQSNSAYYPPGGGEGRGAGAAEFPTDYRERYPSSSAGGGVTPIDWSRAERDYGDYRRRQPPANS